MSALLTIDHLRKTHGARTLFDLHGFSLDEAAAYVLTGVNGAGKSTLMRIIAGLERADPDVRATVTLRGKAMPLHPYPRALREQVVYVHQDPVMFSTSVAHNVAYGLHARGLPRAQVDALVAAAMEWAGITHLQGTDPARLSGGEKQRVALARARVLSPGLLLLDEPTANLDGAAREQVIALIPTLVAEGRTVVMACHDRDLIGTPGVRRMKLREGRLELRQQEEA
ncbi:energy-coupling factor ABC transporter ATP-binding protein [Pseudoduganella sp. GCM10020061]|uniref:energy-coupling factor ABC transporter ATP-binding protein n=1 Tax=Pseudoduganella sp. GCM10020061 TaxID=3317345 RepID=UPI00363B775E